MSKAVIIICGIPYEIKLVDGDYCEQNMGKSDYKNAQIFINKDMPFIVQCNTLLHEIMHMCYRNGYLQKEDEEERIIEVLTNILLPVLQQSPFEILKDATKNA